MKVLFLGNSDVSLPSLREIAKIHEVKVVTGSDKRRGRGKKIKPTKVKEEAIKLGLEVYTPDKVSEGDFLELVKKDPPDIVVVVAFGEILKEEFLKIPKYGVINVHFSLLPKYRGAEPLRRAILDGEKVTGVTIMKINSELDRGDILLQKEIEIDENDDYGTLSEKLAREGAVLLKKALELIEKGDINFIPQDDKISSYAKKFTKEEMEIPWDKECNYIKNLIRALSPKPGAYTFFRGKRIKIYKVRLINESSCKPGRIEKVEKERLIVGCRDSALSIESIQPEGKKIMEIGEFIRGYKPHVGEMFGREGGV